MKIIEARLLFLGVALGVLIAIPIFALLQGLAQPNLVKEYYDTENAVSMSPQDVISHLEKGNDSFILVDLRTMEEYENGHFVTSVNIPAGTMSSQEVVSAFSSLSRDKPPVTYCYSSYCMLSRNVGKLLSDNGMYVKHLTAGWYEISRDYPGFIVNGAGPGAYAPSGSGPVCSIGEIGC